MDVHAAVNLPRTSSHAALLCRVRDLNSGVHFLCCEFKPHTHTCRPAGGRHACCSGGGGGWLGRGVAFGVSLEIPVIGRDSTGPTRRGLPGSCDRVLSNAEVRPLVLALGVPTPAILLESNRPHCTQSRSCLHCRTCSPERARACASQSRNLPVVRLRDPRERYLNSETRPPPTPCPPVPIRVPCGRHWGG